MKDWKLGFLMGAIACVGSVGLLSTISHAQDEGRMPPGQGQPGGGGQGGQGGFGGGRQGGGGFGGGMATMTVSGDYLYILRGNNLYKVSTSDLRVVKEGMLPMPNQGGGPRN